MMKQKDDDDVMMVFSLVYVCAYPLVSFGRNLSECFLFLVLLDGAGFIPPSVQSGFGGTICKQYSLSGLALALLYHFVFFWDVFLFNFWFILCSRTKRILATVTTTYNNAYTPYFELGFLFGTWGYRFWIQGKAQGLHF